MTTKASISAPDAFERVRPFALTLLFGAAAFAIAIAATKSMSDIIGPVFLALVITISLHPIRLWLERHRTPGWATSILMLLAAYLMIVLLVLALLVSVAQVAALLPEYTEEMTEAVTNAGNTLQGLGVQQDQINAVVKAIDPGELVALASSVLDSTLGVLSNLIFLITVLLFLAFDTDSTRRSLTSLGNRYPHPVAALNSFAASTRNYMGVTAVFGFVVACIDGIALWIMGVPGAFVWAVLAFVTSFIPNIGFIIGVIPPALIALLDSGPELMSAVIARLCGDQLPFRQCGQAPHCRRHGGPLHNPDLLVPGVLDLGHRADRRPARRTPHADHQGTPSRIRPSHLVGAPADLGQAGGA